MKVTRRDFLQLSAIGALTYPWLGSAADEKTKPLDSAGSAALTTGQGRPNILFAVADDWSFGHAGAYGCKWVKTPAFDRIAREGLLFMRAYTPTGKCAPSRAAMLTGRNPWQLKAAANHWCIFPPEFKTYAEALAGLGYFVG